MILRESVPLMQKKWRESIKRRLHPGGGIIWKIKNGPIMGALIMGEGERKRKNGDIKSNIERRRESENRE